MISDATPPMPLATALRWADHLNAWLLPYCERLLTAGSIRRQRPICGDVDLVCIPKTTQTEDLFGNIIGGENLCHQFLKDYVDSAAGGATTKFISGGELPGKQVILQLPKCQLDIFFADEKTWATRLLCRTGSKEHNIWLAQKAQDRGYHWNPNEGLTISRTGKLVITPTEESIYATLGLPDIKPFFRETQYLPDFR